MQKSIHKKIIWHLKILAGAFIISILFSLILHQQFFPNGFISIVALTFIQLEIFIWLGARFFEQVKTESPKFKKQIIYRLLYFYFTVLLIAFVVFISVFTINNWIQGGNFSNYFGMLLEMEIKGFIIATLVGFALGALFFFYVQWAEALKREQKLKEEKLVFQYETLKTQVNPHFLFNSLNALSSLVKKDATLSEKFIQKLSSIYRYILENNEKEMVPLSDELEFVRNYFYLQKIRDEEKIELNINLENTEGIKILPVSLQILVENAFKHNSATRKSPLVVSIDFENPSTLKVTNNLQLKTDWTGSSKTGLKNLNERCRLILGREVETQKTQKAFVVKLPVKNT